MNKVGVNSMVVMGKELQEEGNLVSESGRDVVVGVGESATTENNNQDQCIRSTASTSRLHLPDAVAQATISANLQLLNHNL